jgi:hypothetical protein
VKTKKFLALHSNTSHRFAAIRENNFFSALRKKVSLRDPPEGTLSLDVYIVV